MVIPFLVLLAAVPAVVTLHELGHALMARPAGYRLTSFGVGRGRPLLHHRARGGVVLYLGLNMLAGGACVAIPRDPSPGPRAALFHAGGVIAQALLALGLWLLPDWWWVDAVSSFNLLVLASNLLPWRLAGMASDGWWVLAHLRRRGGGGPGLIGRRAVIRRILEFEGRARSPMGVWYAELMLAWTDLLVGRLTAADRFFASARDEAAVDPVLDTLSQYVEASWHRARGRPLAALRLVRDVRRAYGPQLSQRSEDLLAVVEARTWLDLDEPDSARKALSQVAGAAGAVGGEAAVIRLEIALHEGDIEAIARCTRHLGRQWSGAVLDLPAAIRTLSRGVEALGGPSDVEKGQLATLASGAARRLLSQCDATDRHSLATRLGLRPNTSSAGAGYG